MKAEENSGIEGTVGLSALKDQSGQVVHGRGGIHRKDFSLGAEDLLSGPVWRREKKRAEELLLVA